MQFVPHQNDRRTSSRVSTPAATLLIDGVPAELIDISEAGLGVQTSVPLQVGATVNIALDVAGVSVAGTVRVQNADQRNPGRFGLYASIATSRVRRSLGRLHATLAAAAAAAAAKAA